MPQDKTRIDKVIEEIINGRNQIDGKYLISEGELRDILENNCNSYVEKNIVKNCICGKCF